MSDHDSPPVRDDTADLSLDHGPLRQALDAVRAAQDDIQAAKDRLDDQRNAFTDILREQVRDRHAVGSVPETGCRNTLALTRRWAMREGRDRRP